MASVSADISNVSKKATALKAESKGAEYQSPMEMGHWAIKNEESDFLQTLCRLHQGFTCKDRFLPPRVRMEQLCLLVDPHQSFSRGVAWWLVPNSHLARNLNRSGIHFSLSPVVVAIINCCAKLNEPLIQSVGHGIYTLSHNHLCLPIAPLQVHNITLQEPIF